MRRCLAGAALAALAWLSGGPAGPGLLAVTGPAALLTGAAFALEAGAGAALVVGGRSSRRMAASAAAPGCAGPGG